MTDTQNTQDSALDIVSMVALVDGTILEADPRELTAEQADTMQELLLNEKWIAFGLEIDGDYVVVPRERVNFVRLRRTTRHE